MKFRLGKSESPHPSPQQNLINNFSVFNYFFSVLAACHRSTSYPATDALFDSLLANWSEKVLGYWNLDVLWSADITHAHRSNTDWQQKSGTTGADCQVDYFVHLTNDIEILTCF